MDTDCAFMCATGQVQADSITPSPPPFAPKVFSPGSNMKKLFRSGAPEVGPQKI